MAVEVVSAALTVWVGAPDDARALPSEGELLLVEADLHKAQLLKRGLHEREQVAVCVEVLAEQSGTQLSWFVFNDSRLNGPLDEQIWGERYPNLRCIAEEQRIGRRLEEVLNAWAIRQGGTEPLPLSLQLCQGDPLAALAGLGGWTEVLQRVQLSMPAAHELWAQPVQAWLASRGFEAVSDEDAPTWRRDPAAMQRLQLQEQARQIAELEEQLATQAVRLLLAQTRQEELQREHEAVLAERDRLQNQLGIQPASSPAPVELEPGKL